MDLTQTPIEAVETVGPGTVAVDIRAPTGFDARPGQFIKLSPRVGPVEASRFFSISSPRVEDTIEITVAVDPDGTLGPWLAARQPGDPVAIAGPFGSSYYEGESRVVVLAGGPGVGPAVGVAERTLADAGEAAIVYLDDALVHEARLAALAAAGAAVFVVRDRDRLTAATETVLGAGGQLFIYGFARFLDMATDAVETVGRDAAAAKVENFG